MASSTLALLKKELGMGARGNKYRIQLAAPLGPKGDEMIDTLCKAGSIPAKTIGVIPVWSQGRQLQIAGDAAYEMAWNLTFWNTQDHALRDMFDQWLLAIDDMESHVRTVADHASYMADKAQVHQLNTIDNNITATYEFRNLWPTGISSIDLADDAQDAITEFSVDFSFSHWVKVA